MCLIAFPFASRKVSPQTFSLLENIVEVMLIQGRVHFFQIPLGNLDHSVFSFKLR